MCNSLALGRYFLKCDPSKAAETKRCAPQHNIWMQNLSSLFQHNKWWAFITQHGAQLFFFPFPFPFLLGMFSCIDSAGDCLNSFENAWASLFHMHPVFKRNMFVCVVEPKTLDGIFQTSTGSRKKQNKKLLEKSLEWESLEKKLWHHLIQASQIASCSSVFHFLNIFQEDTWCTSRPYGELWCTNLVKASPE